MVMRHMHRLAITVCILSLGSPAFAQFALPSNLQVAPMYRELVESMAERSPTFRGQLLRIATAPRLTIDLDVVPHIVGARAVTRMVRHADGLAARAQVSQFDDVVELIAHELEHVIEQIDGVDLAADAGQPGSGVRATGPMTFETVRAKRIGVIVAQEVRASMRRGN
jgi:hypothetical protein